MTTGPKVMGNTLGPPQQPQCSFFPVLSKPRSPGDYSQWMNIWST